MEDKDLDKEISDAIGPFLSRQYAIEINHAEWLRENQQHLVMAGPAHDLFRVVKDFYQRGRADAMKEIAQSEPDGWCAYDGERLWPNTLCQSMESVHDIVVRTEKTLQIVPVKLIKMEVKSED